MHREHVDSVIKVGTKFSVVLLLVETPFGGRDHPDVNRCLAIFTYRKNVVVEEEDAGVRRPNQSLSLAAAVLINRRKTGGYSW